MDLRDLGGISFNWDFFSALFNIILINLVLAGDNAMAIAMAVRTLPRELRLKGIVLGTGFAILSSVVVTFFVARLLDIKFVKIAGGVMILYLAVDLFVAGSLEDGIQNEAGSMVQAVKIIVIANFTMSFDNMLAVAAASHGNLLLLLFGLGLSIPIVIFTSNLLSILLDKYPVIIYIGAAMLGKVGGEMIITDPFIMHWLEPTEISQYAVESSLAVGVVLLGKLRTKWMVKSEEMGSDQIEVEVITTVGRSE